MSILQPAQQQHRMATQRKLRRVRHASFPFFPYWFIPILSLGLLSLFATSCVQSTTQNTTNKALEDIGADWVRPDISGRWVTLRGTPPADANTGAIYSAVRNAKSRTLFGSGIQATRVKEDYTTARKAPASVTPPIVPPGAELNTNPPQTGTNKHTWAFSRRENILTLTGELPDEAMRKSVIESAEFAANGARIEDRLTISGRQAASGYSTTALRGVQALGRCTSGTASFDGDIFNLRCETRQAEASALRRLASAPLAFGTIGDISVLATEAIESCESQLDNLLADARIEFATGSAIINAASGTLLSLIATEAQNCPGTLSIEGHTDNEGSAEINAELSLQRANAVRLELISRGLSATRLATEGFGPTRPIASNDTSLGRARNRRIQFRVVRP